MIIHGNVVIIIRLLVSIFGKLCSMLSCIDSNRVPHLGNSIAVDCVLSNNRTDCMDTSTVITSNKTLGDPDSTENFNSEELQKDKLCNQSENNDKRNYSTKVNHTAVTMESQVAAVVSLHKRIIAHNVT